MNQQEIFDKVATHLIAQGRQSLVDDDDINEQFCAYRDPYGAMCAAGCLIPDAEYRDEFETQPWAHIWPDIPTFANAPQSVNTLIAQLQLVHDDENNWKTAETLKEALSVVANEYGLSLAVLN